MQVMFRSAAALAAVEMRLRRRDFLACAALAFGGSLLASLATQSLGSLDRAGAGVVAWLFAWPSAVLFGAAATDPLPEWVRSRAVSAWLASGLRVVSTLAAACLFAGLALAGVSVLGAGPMLSVELGPAARYGVLDDGLAVAALMAGAGAGLASAAVSNYGLAAFARGFFLAAGPPALLLVTVDEVARMAMVDVTTALPAIVVWSWAALLALLAWVAQRSRQPSEPLPVRRIVMASLLVFLAMLGAAQALSLGRMLQARRAADAAWARLEERFASAGVESPPDGSLQELPNAAALTAGDLMRRPGRRAARSSEDERWRDFLARSWQGPPPVWQRLRTSGTWHSVRIRSAETVKQRLAPEDWIRRGWSGPPSPYASRRSSRSQLSQSAARRLRLALRSEVPLWGAAPAARPSRDEFIRAQDALLGPMVRKRDALEAMEASWHLNTGLSALGSVPSTLGATEFLAWQASVLRARDDAPTGWRERLETVDLPRDLVVAFAAEEQWLRERARAEDAPWPVGLDPTLRGSMRERLTWIVARPIVLTRWDRASTAFAAELDRLLDLAVASTEVVGEELSRDTSHFAQVFHAQLEVELTVLVLEMRETWAQGEVWTETERPSTVCPELTWRISFPEENTWRRIDLDPDPWQGTRRLPPLAHQETRFFTPSFGSNTDFGFHGFHGVPYPEGTQN